MMTIKKMAGPFVLMLLALTGARAEAAMSPLGISIVPPLQFPPENFTVTGLRANVLFGNHQKVYGFDLGVVGNITSQNLTGVQLAGGFNFNKGETHAVLAQVAGGGNWNVNKASIVGIQAAVLVNSNKAESSLVGVGVAALNLTDFTKVYGIQAGLYNSARVVTGFQIGIVNKTDELRGFQIGLINFNNKGLFSVSPFLNFGF
jgi:hypothetical protein